MESYNQTAKDGWHHDNSKRSNSSLKRILKIIADFSPESCTKSIPTRNAKGVLQVEKRGYETVIQNHSKGKTQVKVTT